MIEEKIQEDVNINSEAMKEFTDIVFIVESKEIKAHKIILASKSIYFMNMFESNELYNT